MANYVTMKEFLNLAIDFEHDSAEYYARLWDKVPGDKEKELCSELENEESSHADTLSLHNVDEESEARIQFTPELSLSMPEIKADAEVQELIKGAIAREEKSVKIYEYASDFAVGKFKALLKDLADFERAHIRKLNLIRMEYKKQ
jgi:rubrerythrin